MMGCSVNLSARLMASAAKNTIQVNLRGKTAPFEATTLLLYFQNFLTLVLSVLAKLSNTNRISYEMI